MKLGLAASLLALAGAAHAADPAIAGKWLGTIGGDKERIEVGLEFKQGKDGKLVLLLTQPISNYFGVDAGGVLTVEGNSITHDVLSLSLQLKGDTLTGFFPGPNSSALLKRVKSLPQEQAPPRLPSGPEPRWTTRLGGQIYATPVVADGSVYVGTTGGVLNALNAATGELQWTFSAQRPIHGAAAVDGDAVLFAADDGLLYKLDRKNGKELWRYDLGDADRARILPHPNVYDWDWQGAQPLVAAGSVYVGAADGGFHAVDLASGQRRWLFQSQGKIRNGAAIDGDKVVFGSADHRVYALAHDSGKEVWRFDTAGEVDATPLIHNGRVIVGSRSASLFSLRADTGELDWRLYFWGSWVESTATIAEGVLYIGSSDLRRVSAVDPANGHVIWRTDVYGWTWGTPLVVSDQLYVAAAGGTPYFVKHVASFNRLDRKTGQLLTRQPLPDTGGHQWGIAGSPVRAGELVIVGRIEGALMAYPL